ncbi:hypothetical protein FA95DRAFT_1578913, partial [Auriscalpium vulgare]
LVRGSRTSDLAYGVEFARAADQLEATAREHIHDLTLWAVMLDRFRLVTSLERSLRAAGLPQSVTGHPGEEDIILVGDTGRGGRPVHNPMEEGVWAKTVEGLVRSAVLVRGGREAVLRSSCARRLYAEAKLARYARAQLVCTASVSLLCHKFAALRFLFLTFNPHPLSSRKLSMADPSALADFARDIVVADLASVEADLPASGTVAERQAWCVRATVVSERLWALLGRAVALPPGVADRLRLLDSAVGRLRPADPAPAPTFAPLAPFPAPSPPAASPARPTPAPRKKK